ncbi:MAG: hypothetical protein DRQ62_08060 [Gammaproteobacteria bacterium]|nr:MAG: hypothetical protein DRQ62_08060 [Gammaproteobacteria bacterium]
MKQIRLNLFSAFFVITLMMFFSCNETTKVDLPTSAVIHYSVVDKQVAFTALTHNADSWLWDFGDGETSTEKNPVHVYADGGYYTVTLTVTGGTGTADDESKLAVALTPYVLLTGGPTAVNGKTWKLTASHTSSGDYFANADAELTAIDGVPAPLPDGVFDLLLDMGEVYQDKFTFHFDGGYSHDVMDDGAAFGGMVYQVVLNGGVDLVNTNGIDFGLCTAKYTPESGATFTFVENEDIEVSSVYSGTGVITFSNVSTLDFSGTEFVGFRDFQQKVIVQKLTDSSMKIVMFMAAGQDPSIIGFNTHALVLSFEVVS